MAIKIKGEDAKTCFRCQSNPPQFRLISLQNLPTDGGSLEPDCLVELLCTNCLRPEIDDLYEALPQSNLPLGEDESPEICVTRQIGFAVVPVLFRELEAQLLIGELRTDGGVELEVK